MGEKGGGRKKARKQGKQGRKNLFSLGKSLDYQKNMVEKLINEALKQPFNAGFFSKRFPV